MSKYKGLFTFDIDNHKYIPIVQADGVVANYDYDPEPLIKDMKIRKAVRAWADANNINSKHYYETDVSFDSVEHCFTWIDTSIQFNEIAGLENLEHGKKYTIAELCGEGEE